MAAAEFVALSELQDRSPISFPVGRPVAMRFREAIVIDPATMGEKSLREPVDFSRWGQVPMPYTDPETGGPAMGAGISLVVQALGEVTPELATPPVTPDKVAAILGLMRGSGRRMNVISKRLVRELRPYLEAGTFLTLGFIVTKNAPRPETTWSVLPFMLPG